MNVPRYSALVATALLTLTGCPKPRTVKKVAPPVNPSALTGVWMGTLRDRPALRVHREVRVLAQLTAHRATGKLTGDLSHRGALSTAYAGTLQCNGEARAELKRTAPLSHGRLTPQRLSWTLGKVTQAGARACGFRFPLGKQCTATPRSDGGLNLRCGKLRLTLYRVAITGVWAWDETRTDQAGDHTVKRQRFHLVQRGAALTGHADNLKVNISQDGQRYRCNGHLRYTQQTRQHISGQLRGLTVRLKLAPPVRRTGPCAGTDKLPTELVGTWKPFEDRLELPLTKTGRKLRRLPGLMPLGATPPRQK